MTEPNPLREDEVAALLRREGRYAGLWFGDKLIEAADRLDVAQCALQRIAAYPSSTTITSDMHCERETLINIARAAILRLDQVREGRGK